MHTLDFTQRSTRAELMDTEPVEFEDFRACLRDLARVNRLTLAYRPTLAFFERLWARHGVVSPSATGQARRRSRPIEVLDVGSGYGDMLRAIHSWAQRRGVRVALTGIDLNPWSRRAAREATPSHVDINWVTADAFSYDPPRGVDVVISSLFAHHLPDPLVVRFLRWMQQRARLGWFVNDLQRHRLPYVVFHQAARALRLHRFVQHDGPVSIARAFQPADWSRLLGSAELDGADITVRRAAPFRLTVERFARATRDPATPATTAAV